MDMLNSSEERELTQRLQQKQVKDFMITYNNLVQRCFNDCVNDFTSQSLMSKEEGCVMRCIDKFIKSSERLGERFQELNAKGAAQGGMGMGR